MRKRGLIAFVAIAAAALVAAGCGSSSSSSGGGKQTSSTLKRVTSSHVLRVGFLSDAPPFGFMDDNNKFVGIDPAFADLMARDLGARVQAKILPNADARITALQTGAVDIVFGDFSMTPERAEAIAFSQPYGAEIEVLIGRAGDPPVNSYTDLAGRKVGVVTGALDSTLLPTLAPDAKFVTYDDLAARLPALKAHQIDAMIMDLAPAQELVKRDTSIAILGNAYRDFLGLGIRRGDYDWQDWVNDFITYHGGSGELGAIYRKWTGQDMPHILPSF